MALVTADIRTPPAQRSRAERFNNGVIAGYIHSLSATSMKREQPEFADGGRTESPVRPPVPALPSWSSRTSNSGSQRWATALVTNAIWGACGVAKTSVSTRGA
jgi:hypothetical protein